MDLEREIIRLRELEQRRGRLYRELAEAQARARKHLASRDLDDSKRERRNSTSRF